MAADPSIHLIVPRKVALHAGGMPALTCFALALSSLGLSSAKAVDFRDDLDSFSDP